MSSVKVASFSISVDGFGAGPDQDLDHPLGVGGTDLHRWFFRTRAFQRAHSGTDPGDGGTGEGDGGTGEGSGGIDDAFAERAFTNVGAWILGRNMFGPIRGPWPDLSWKGWWGDDPPYHVPVFVLTHHARPPLEMQGGTTFHFVTGGFEEALEQARQAAGGKDVRVGGGPDTIRQGLRAGLIDELHIAIVPVVLGRGERLFRDLDLRGLGYRCVESAASDSATHVVLRHKARGDG